MKNLILIAVLFTLFSSQAYCQVENVLVEKYYYSDANDSADTDGGYLPMGSITYRVFVDLKKGSAITKIYGDSLHALKFFSSNPFFNNTDRGKSYGYEIDNTKLNKNTVALDSWITLAAASKKHLGIPKTFDPDSSIVGGVNNDGGSVGIVPGLISNNNSVAGIPVTDKDGMVQVLSIPANFLPSGDLPLLFSADTSIFGNNSYSYFESNNAALQCSGASGIDSLNLVLVAQLTTVGDINFNINIEVKDSLGNLIRYVANGNDTSYIQNQVLVIEKVSPFLSYPASCGCTDPFYLEYSTQYACSDSTACLTKIKLGCMDQLACNYDSDANFNVPEMCCYPGYCNDRNLDVVCPDLSSGNRELQVYPNPTSMNMIVKLNGVKQNFVKVELFNQFGLLLFSSQYEMNIENSFNLDLQLLTHGIYFLKVITDNEVFNKTVIKQ